MKWEHAYKTTGPSCLVLLVCHSFANLIKQDQRWRSFCNNTTTYSTPLLLLLFLLSPSSSGNVGTCVCRCVCVCVRARSRSLACVCRRVCTPTRASARVHVYVCTCSHHRAPTAWISGRSNFSKLLLASQADRMHISGEKAGKNYMWTSIEPPYVVAIVL